MNYIPHPGDSAIRRGSDTLAWQGCTPKAVHADRLNFFLHDLHLGGDRIGSRA
jgi:hypothetical protein